MITTATHDTTLGRVVITIRDGALAALHLDADAPVGAIPDGAAADVARQIDEYLGGARETFDVPLGATGTAFQHAVWDELSAIPYGETRTYGEIATRLVRSPVAARAVGAACAGNPLWVVVPCHRAIGANGSLTGYAGGLDVKRTLLELEGALPGAQLSLAG